MNVAGQVMLRRGLLPTKNESQGERDLRVGVVGPIPHPTEGGASSLLETLVEELKVTQSRHVFIPLKLGEGGHSNYLRMRLRATWFGDIVARGLRLVRPPSVPQLDSLVREQQIDVVWFLREGGSRVSVPYITTVWDLAHRSRPYFPEVSITGWDWERREQTYSTVLPRASFILTGTNAGKREVVHYYRVNPENVVVVPLPVPRLPSEGRQAVDIRGKYKIRGDFLLYPAQFWPHKNHVNILIALALLKHRGVLIEIVFTGGDKGNAEHVFRKINELGLHDQVHMLGFIPREDLKTLYSKALALTFASFFGPDNLPPLEAFALGCPVIASRVSGAEEQLRDAAFFFDPADPEDLASAILTISRDQQLRAQMVKKGAEIARIRTPQAYVERVCNVLDRFATVRHCWGCEYKHT
jgi:glycosyltransferase involved in cell wall biosynthesis